jgi:putative toxin-antitoxin system antitoxin component (TIGR02293 family)
LIDPSSAPKDPRALTDVRPLLTRMITAYGHNPIARLLDVDAAMVTRWKRGAKISAAMAHRILDLHAVLARALQVFTPEVATQWLVGHEPFLNDARPIDVLAVRGSAPLVEALDAIAAGAYA